MVNCSMAGQDKRNEWDQFFCLGSRESRKNSLAHLAGAREYVLEKNKRPQGRPSADAYAAARGFSLKGGKYGKNERSPLQKVF